MKVQQPESDHHDIVGFESLPSEVHHLIFDWLPFDTLARLNEVCSFWKMALDDEILWRRHYTLIFGPLSGCHLTLPLPPHLQGTTFTPTKVLKWKKRFCLMRNLSQCHGILCWPLLHRSPQLTEQKMSNWDGEGFGVEKERRAEVAMAALLIGDLKLLELVGERMYYSQVREENPNPIIFSNLTERKIQIRDLKYYAWQRSSIEPRQSRCYLGALLPECTEDAIFEVLPIACRKGNTRLAKMVLDWSGGQIDQREIAPVLFKAIKRGDAKMVDTLIPIVSQDFNQKLFARHFFMAAKKEFWGIARRSPCSWYIFSQKKTSFTESCEFTF